MKNKEIEELLKDLNHFDGTYALKANEIKELLSYIEQLKNLCNKYEQEHKTTFEIWKKDIKKLEQLENNRDKAIEYIKEFRFATVKFEQHSDTLLNILKGDSDE